MSICTYDSIEAGLRGCFGSDVGILEKSYVNGGDINDSFCLNLSNGLNVFVKSNTVRFGRELASMHLKDTEIFVPGGKYGFSSDNCIGASKQVNTPKDTWIDFFRECRLIPQFRMAEGYFDNAEAKSIMRLLENLICLKWLI